MTNEEKAKKICANCMLKNKPFPKQLLEKELTHCDLCPSASIALKAMRWKDEQYAKEKQQWIEKTIDFISKRFYIGINNQVTSKENYNSLTELIRDFKQEMKGDK